MKIEVTVKQQVEVKYLQARCGVRYWEDAKVDDVEDTEGTLIPCRDGDDWSPLIELETGRIENWKQGVTADIHYKVCDDGDYMLLDENRQLVKAIYDDYVPSIMCPKDSGYGDYVIMDVDANGVIQNWMPNLDEFTGDGE